MVLYADEVFPGNQLAAVNARKVWAVYYSFLQFDEHLHNELAWAPLTAEPSKSLKTVSAGISQVMAVIIKSFFMGKFDLRNGGILLTSLDGSTTRLWVKLSMFIQDGGAHKLVSGNKGDAGTRLCMLCKNLVSESSCVTCKPGTEMLTSSMIREDAIVIATDADIRDTLRRLVAHKATDS